MAKHILINSYIRSGGSLLARLLDGHPDLYVLPVEMSYSKRKVLFPNVSDNVNSFNDLVQEMNLERTFNKLDQNAVISKDPYGKQRIEFSYSTFLDGVKKRLNDYGAIKLSHAVAAIYESFFENWNALDSSKNDKQEKYGYVNHLSAMCYGDYAEFFDSFPEGKIIQTIRDPRSWYASVKTHIGIKDDQPLFLVFAMHLWVESNIRGLIAAKLKSDRYSIIRYEDLVVDLDNTLNEVCKSLNIEYNEILKHPTMGGIEWKGNSAYGQKRGVDDSGLYEWKRVLTRNELLNIDKITNEVAGILGYTEAGLENILWDIDELSLTNLGLRIPLSVETETERYKYESIRMTAVMHAIFHEKMTRYFGRRYHRKSIFRRLIDHIK